MPKVSCGALFRSNNTCKHWRLAFGATFRMEPLVYISCAFVVVVLLVLGSFLRKYASTGKFETRRTVCLKLTWRGSQHMFAFALLGDNTINNISLFLFFPLSTNQGWCDACNFFTASSVILLHPPLSPVFFFQSPSSPVFVTSLFTFTQSSHLTFSDSLSLGLPRPMTMLYLSVLYLSSVKV